MKADRNSVLIQSWLKSVNIFLTSLSNTSTICFNFLFNTFIKILCLTLMFSDRLCDFTYCKIVNQHFVPFIWFIPLIFNISELHAAW